MAQSRAVHLRFVTVVFWKPTFEDGGDTVRAYRTDVVSNQIRCEAERCLCINHHNQNLGPLGTRAHGSNLSSEGASNGFLYFHAGDEATVCVDDMAEAPKTKESAFLEIPNITGPVKALSSKSDPGSEICPRSLLVAVKHPRGLDKDLSPAMSSGQGADHDGASLECGPDIDPTMATRSRLAEAIGYRKALGHSIGGANLATSDRSHGLHQRSGHRRSRQHHELERELPTSCCRHDATR
jgi:hypothetical protein